ncbi:hypothetical protein WJX75_002889 [Coccomyxa subellipsoidea]|uniref:WD40 repeat-like protein n=1 Tax=Coccomyxa subellipsoidea TaxID=248742 RepID=A0ABR2YMB1_9CHLO
MVLTGAALEVGNSSITAREAQAYCGAYHTFSAPLNLPVHRQESAQLPATILPLFGAAQALGNGREEYAGAPVTEAPTSSQRGGTSAVAFCGGPIWSLDWCPFQQRNAQYLAVAAHSKARERNVIGSSSRHGRLGLLAVVLGSGELHLLSVPDPYTAPAAAQDQPAGTSTLISGDTSGLSASQFVRLQPEASAAASAVGGSLPNVAEWLPRAPHDLLLVGFWDGTVALWRVLGSETKEALRMELLLHMPAQDGPVRGLAWAPPEVATAAGDRAERHLFATVGHSHKLRIWDTRNLYSPLLEAPLQAHWKLGVEWLADPAGVVIAEDGGSLRWMDLNPFNRTSRMSPNTNISGGQGTVWCVHCQPGGRRIAYAGADGEVAVVGLERDMAAQPHSVLAGFRWEAGVLTVLDRTELAGGSRVAAGSRAQSRMSVSEEAIHRVRWSCAPPEPEAAEAGSNLPGPSAEPAHRGPRKEQLGREQPPALLACGGAAGVLLIVRV